MPTIYTDSIGIYFPNDPSQLPPRFRVLREVAREWRNLGLGAFINKAKAFRLNFTPKDDPEVRGRSCRVSEQVLIEAIGGSAPAMAIIEAWA